MDHTKAQQAMAPLLAPVSKLYSGIMNLRARAYANGFKKSYKSEAFCVSVGNIAWGGSGKTPLADWLLAWAREKGLTPALLTRGYGGKSEERPLLVKSRTSPDESGDEPLMLARRHPDAYILADPKRRRALDWLSANTTANFIVLDDGMQHLAIRRDLDLVLLRGKDIKDGWGKVIPAGEWREGPAALRRASAFLIRMSSTDWAGSQDLIKERLQKFGKPVFSFDLLASGLTPLGVKASQLHGPEALLSNLGGRPYVLCTGVGSPESVIKSSEKLLHTKPEQSFIYPDHHKFSAKDLKHMTPGLPIVMTGKDAVKIQPLLLQESQAECYILQSEVVFGPALFADTTFSSWFESLWHQLV